MDLDPNKLRARFAEIAKRREAIRSKADPLRAERDKFVQANAKKEAAMIAAIKKAEDGLYDLDQEAAMISRALGGKTGSAE